MAKLVLELDASMSFHYSDQYSSAGCVAGLFSTNLCSTKLLADTCVDKIALKDKRCATSRALQNIKANLFRGVFLGFLYSVLKEM